MDAALAYTVLISVDSEGDTANSPRASTLIDSDSEKSEDAILISAELANNSCTGVDAANKLQQCCRHQEEVQSAASPFRADRFGSGLGNVGCTGDPVPPNPNLTLEPTSFAASDAGAPDSSRKKLQRGARARQPGIQESLGAKRTRLLAPQAAKGRDPAIAALLRAERRERSARLRDGEVQLPPPVVGFSHAVATNCTLHTLDNGWQVYFPVDPMTPQCQVMTGALDSLARGGCALLESPTGTGKTLALLSSALAYQKHRDAMWRDAGMRPPPAPAIHSQAGEQAGAAATSKRAAANTQAGGDQEKARSNVPPPPRVVWVARTHEQLQHAIRELRRLPYRPMEALRISRERFCLHPLVQKMPDRAAACELATTTTKQGVMIGGGVTGCDYLDHAEAVGYPNRPEHRAKFEADGHLAVHDIEDLITEAHATFTCPYHAALDLTAEGAGVIFATYPQLLDPCVRMTSSFDAVLKDAVVVVDEAHNLPQAARDAGSFRTNLGQLRKLLQDVQGLAAATQDLEVVRLAELVSTALARLCEWLEDIVGGGEGPTATSASLSSTLKLVEVAEGKELRDPDGRGCVTLVSQIMGLETSEKIETLVRMLKALRKKFIDHGLEGWAVRSSVVNSIDDFLRKMGLILQEEGSGSYVLIVGRPDLPSMATSATLAMLSLRGATAFNAAVQDSHAVLLASGTLTPFKLLASELGLAQPKQQQLEHLSRFGSFSNMDDMSPESDQRRLNMPLAEVVEAQQSDGVRDRLLVLAFGAVEGQRLSSTLQHRRNGLQGYVDILGRTLAVLTAVVPNGSLVFFPSYGQLRDAVTRWRVAGLLTSLRDGGEMFAGKPAVVESPDLNPEAFAAALQRYRRKAVTKEGAVLLAVMRGRCAEGADFKDEAARCVAVVGVPYPALDIEVRLKKEFEQRSGRGSMWYDAEAYRSISQAAGRLLRHRSDYGCLLLLDERLAGFRPPAQLSGWLREELSAQRAANGSAASSSLDAAACSIKSFFQKFSATKTRA